MCPGAPSRTFHGPPGFPGPASDPSAGACAPTRRGASVRGEAGAAVAARLPPCSAVGLRTGPVSGVQRGAPDTPAPVGVGGLGPGLGKFACPTRRGRADGARLGVPLTRSLWSPCGPFRPRVARNTGGASVQEAVAMFRFSRFRKYGFGSGSGGLTGCVRACKYV